MPDQVKKREMEMERQPSMQKKAVVPAQTIPVVIRADLIMAGDQSGWTDLMRATTPETWGHAMEVPELKFQFTDRLSYGTKYVGVDLGDHAASMFTPGAATSGYVSEIKRFRREFIKIFRRSSPAIR